MRLFMACLATVVWTGAALAQTAQQPNEVQAKIEATIGSLYVQNAQLAAQAVAAAGQVATLNKQLKDATAEAAKLKKQLAEAQAKTQAPKQAPPK